jgi:hypothetical protein
MNFELQNKIICFTAKRNSGKSQLLRYMLLSSKKLFSKIFVICPTEPVNKFYSDLIPKENVFVKKTPKFIVSPIRLQTPLTGKEVSVIPDI